MGVDHDRVHALGAVQHPAILGGRRCRTGVGGIDVQPQAAACADVGDRRDRIHAGRRGRAGGGDHRARSQPGRGVFGDGVLERRGIHAQLGVDRNGAQAVTSQAEDHGRLRDRRVRLGGRIDAHGWQCIDAAAFRRGVTGRVAGCSQSVERAR